jgi:predicted nuclease with TOPRIM domain
MELMESRWTDDRMDDLKHQVDVLGQRMEEGFAEQRREMNARFDRLEKSLEKRFEKIDERFERVDERFQRVDERFDKVDERFERIDAKFNAKFDAVHDQIARTQESVIGLYAMISRFSLWLAGAVVVTVVGALLTLLLR